MSASATIRGLVARAVRWTLYDEGSTRGLGLIRIGVALMLWARFGDSLGVYADSSAWELALTAAYFAASTLLLFGLATRPAAIVVAAAVFYGRFGLEWRSHNIQLLSLTTAILALTPCGRSYSVDRWLALRRAERTGRAPPPERAPLWSTRLFVLLISSVYLATAYNKTTLAYLRGERLSSIFSFHYTGSAYLDGPVWTGVMLGGSVLVWGLELALAIGLLIPALRKGLTLAGVALHLSFYAMFRVYTFSTNMLLLYLPFYDQDRLARGVERLCPADAPAASTRRAVGRARLLTRAAGLLIVVALITAAAVVDLRTPRVDVTQSQGSASAADPAGPRVQLLDDRWGSFLPTKARERRLRSQQTRREMQRWRGV